MSGCRSQSRGPDTAETVPGTTTSALYLTTRLAFTNGNSFSTLPVELAHSKTSHVCQPSLHAIQRLISSSVRLFSTAQDVLLTQ
jgi:hypothetical protein